jgi:hypothetical protein
LVEAATDGLIPDGVTGAKALLKASAAEVIDCGELLG